MSRRVVEEPLDPRGAVRDTADEGSGALVVAHAPASPATAAETAAGSARAEEAGRVLAALEDQALGRFDIRRCRLRVRARAPDGEAAVEAVVRAAHRADAFDAAHWALSEARERVLPLLAGSADGP